jgi:hypothetical protein
VYTSSASASSTGSPSRTPPPKGSSANTGAIASGVVGGIAAISITVAAGFLYLRLRSRAPSTEFAGTGASQPHMDDASRSLSDGGTVAPSPSSGSPVTMRFYVRILAPCVAPVCPHVPLAPSLFPHPRDPNDPTTFPGCPDPRSLDTLPQVSTSSQIGSGSTWPPRRPLPRAPRDITAFPCPLYDHPLRSHRRSLGRIALLLPFFPIFSP